METALWGASGGWVTGCKPAHITAFAGAKTLVENEKGWFDHPFFSSPNPTHGCHASMSCNGNPTGGCNASTGCNRNTTGGCNPLLFTGKNKDCVKLLFCAVFFASAGTLFGAAIQRL